MASRRETLSQRLDRIEKRAPERKKRIIVVTETPSVDSLPEVGEAESFPKDDSGAANDEAD